MSSTTPASLGHAYEAIRREAVGLAGGPGDMPPRVALLHTIFADSNGNHAFPEVALHGALWAFGFYERRGTVSRAIAYRYFYDGEERARRSYMLFEFSQGFKEANRSVFVDTYANYVFSKRHGEQPGADEFIAPALLEELNRVHHAARDRRRLTPRERAKVFEQALLFEQELTVGPKIREEVAKFDCPILSAIVLRPVVRFSYFPRTTYLTFSNFGSTEERIEKAVRSYDLAERVGWPRVGSAIQRAAVLPQRFFERPRAYADELADAASVARPLAL
ncbi:MAG: hypothetical protein ABI317_06685 [Gaiellales bacterium]